LRLSYSYHNTNTLSTIIDAVSPSLNASLTYDPNDRLATVARSGDYQGFALDPVSNRTSHTRQGASYTFTRDPASNRLSAWSPGGAGQWRNFSHDAVGNVYSEARHDRSYGHDALNRLITFCDLRPEPERVWVCVGQGRFWFRRRLVN
jgi:hypothetical protein